MFLFSKENAVALVRTVVTFVYGWLLTQWPVITDFLPDVPPETLAIVIGGLLYQIIRIAAEKFPKVGWLLIFNTKPQYDKT